MNVNNELYFKNCFTETDDGKVNAEFNQIMTSCIGSNNNKFSMDSEGNLVVNSIITRQNNNLEKNFDAIYPIGSFYFTSSNTNPSILFGGSWRQIKDKFILSCGDKYENGSIGGEENVKLDFPNYQYRVYGTEENNPDNDLSHFWYPPSGGYGLGSVYTANKNVPHNNMPPYLAVYVWERIS